MLGVESLPDHVTEILKEGPKFATEPVQKPPELLELVRHVAERANLPEEDRCVVEGVKCLSVHARNRRARLDLRPLKRHFVDNDLSLMLSDKEGGFVVASRYAYLC